jgi:hypothetical protein
METPQKYKSVPSTSVYNRTIVLLDAAKKAKLNTIIQNFIQYLKVKHS